MENMSVSQFIRDNWDKCKRYEPEDRDTLIGMPYPYITPTASNMFQEMYYWDTYFACEGLVLVEKTDLAKSCADNMAYMINKYGLMPNGNRTYYLNHSQPPYFCMLVNLVFESTGDKAWLKQMYDVIEKEYTFWQTERISPNGLNCYGSGKYDEEQGKELYDLMSRRFHIANCFDRYEGYADIAENIIAECESGWDFNPRFGYRCKDYNPVDLNSNLYLYETLMAKFADVLHYEDIWTERAAKRKELINKYLWNGRYFCDYNHVKDEKSEVVSAAMLHPLWAGVADSEQAEKTRSALGMIEFDCGISACEKADHDIVFQWDYPNAWAPLQFIAVKGLGRYGFAEDALRIAKKYVASIEAIFEKTNNLWEKYNAVNGTINVANEYDMPDMLGWTAGVYLVCNRYLKDGVAGCFKDE